MDVVWIWGSVTLDVAELWEYAGIRRGDKGIPRLTPPRGGFSSVGVGECIGTTRISCPSPVAGWVSLDDNT